MSNFKCGVWVILSFLLILAGCESDSGATATVAQKVGVKRFVFSNTNIGNEVSAHMQTVLGLSNGEARELMVKIWYPALNDADESSRRHYGYHTESTDFAVNPNEPDLLQVLRGNLVESHSYQDAEPITSQRFPVVLYSHGYGTFVEDNEPYFEKLATNGLIVVSIGHTLEAGLVTLNDDNIVAYSDTVEEDFGVRSIPLADRNPELVMSDTEAVAMSSVELGDAVPETLLAKYHYNAEVATGTQDHLNLWVDDTRFVVSQLEKLNTGEISSPLQGIFNLERIGAVGYSFGGATAKRFCNLESRCQASINMDGSSYSLHNEAIQKPHLLITSDVEATIDAIRSEGATEEDIDEYRHYSVNELHTHVAAAEDDLYLMTLKTITHSGFAGGWIDLDDPGLGKDVWHPILENMSVNYFSAYLKDNSQVLSTTALCALVDSEDALTSNYDNICNN